MGLDFGVVFDGDGGFAGVGGVAFEAGGDAGAGGEDGVVPDGDVAGDADLGGDGYVVANFCAACDAGLGDDEAVFADGAVVADLDEVIDFGALADGGFAKACAVDGGVGADFDVVCDFDDTDLGDFLVLMVMELVAVSIGADDGAGVDDDVVADDGALEDGDVGADAAVCADSDVAVDDGVWGNFRSIADAGVFHDDCAGVDADLGGVRVGAGADDGGGVDAGGEVCFGCREVSDDFREGEGGIGNGEEGGASRREVVPLGDDDGTGFGGEEVREIFFVAEEAYVAGGGGVECGHSGEYGGGLTAQDGSIDAVSEIGEAEGCGLSGCGERPGHSVSGAVLSSVAGSSAVASPVSSGASLLRSLRRTEVMSVASLV